MTLAGMDSAGNFVQARWKGSANDYALHCCAGSGKTLYLKPFLSLLSVKIGRFTTGIKLTDLGKQLLAGLSWKTL
jgi:hypothetical protein